MQLLTIAIPKLRGNAERGRRWKKEDSAITRYVTVGLALFESTAMAIGFGRRGLSGRIQFCKCCNRGTDIDSRFRIPDVGWRAYHRKGVGNGISIVLLINIISGMPDDFTTLL